MSVIFLSICFKLKLLDNISITNFSLLPTFSSADTTFTKISTGHESNLALQTNLKNDAKFEEELTYQFKIGMNNLANFDPSTQKSQKIALHWAAFEKVYNLEAKESTEDLFLMAMKIDAKCEGKLTCAF